MNPAFSSLLIHHKRIKTGVAHAAVMLFIAKLMGSELSIIEEKPSNYKRKYAVTFISSCRAGFFRQATRLVSPFERGKGFVHQ